MTFDRPWVIFLLWLPFAWATFEWTRTRRKLGLILKTLAFVAILAALAQPRLDLHETKLAVAVLADTSASASTADLNRATEIAEKISAARGRNVLNIVPFAHGIRPLAGNELKTPFHLTATSGEAGRSTDLEAAVREAIAALPSGLVPRLTLI